jgi:hypothetical protein
MDIYRDYFNREELVRVLAQSQYTPGRLGQLGIFEPVPIGSTVFAVEEEAKNGRRILTPIQRGAPRQVTNIEATKVHTFVVSSYGDQGTVFADEVLNARGGINGQKEVIETRRATLVGRLRGNMDYTHEKIRMDCLLSPGSAEFGSAGAGVVIAVQTETTKLRQEIFNKLTVPIRTALDGTSYSGITVLCSDGYWADLIEAKSIKETYLNQSQAAEMRGEIPERFSFGGVVWENYRGTTDVKIPDNEAVAVPTGVQGAFWLPMAPNDTMESVGAGALGQPYYMGSKAIEDSQGTKGWEISIQSHVRAVCGRPGAIKRLTKA